MADRGHELTDEILNSLENRIADEYAVATRDMQHKFREYMEKFEAEDEKQKALLKAGKITKKEYKDWRYRHMMVGKRWEAMKDVLAEDLKHASDIALKISGEKMADVYALNANFATYQIEHDAKIDTGFTLYNHDTAEYLLSDERQLMPGPSTRKAKEIAANKAMQWDKQKIQSAVLQGVLQGEGPHKVAERLRQVGQMDYNASVRYARTMTTSAQNAGRYNSFRRARDLGVDLTIEWMATLDGHTRHAHREMHGQRTTVDEPFYTPDGYTIYYPADCTGESTAPQSEIWNCRCTLRAMVKGYERETIKSSPGMGDMTFEEWQQEKAPKTDSRKAVKRDTTNIFGEEIKFSDKMDSQKWDGTKEAIKDLASEYKTKLKDVEVVSAAKHMAAGSVQISGTVMQLSSSDMATVFHEFAHSISIQNQTKFGLYNEETFWKEVSSVRRKYRSTVKDDTSRWISTYEHSEKSLDEFMAEAFTLSAMVEKGYTPPSKYGKDLTFANQVLAIVKKHFGRQ